MSDEKCLIKIHPEGEPQTAGVEGEEAVTSLDTFAGKIQIKWTPDAEVSSLGLRTLRESSRIAAACSPATGRGVFSGWIWSCMVLFVLSSVVSEKIRRWRVPV